MVSATISLVLGLTAALLVFLTSPLPLTSSLLYLLGIVLMVSAVLYVPQLRLNRTQTMSPRNLMLLSFALKIVVVPVLIALAGYSQGLLPNLPALLYIHQAHGVYILAMLTCFVGFTLVHRTPRYESPWSLPNWLLILLGVVALPAASYQLLLVIAGAGGATAPNSANILQVITTFFRALAPIVVLAILFGRRPIEGRRAFPFWKLSLGSALLVIVAFSINRASIIYPVLALFTVYALFNTRLRYSQIMLFGLLALTAVFYAGQARERYLLGEYTYQTRKHLSRADNAIEGAQVYFNAPQFGAYAIREFNAAPPTLTASLLESVPILGEQFRSESGSYLYNFSIYRHFRARDQVYPAPIEVFVNLGWLGVVGVYLVVGALIAALHNVFVSSRRNVFLAYISAYLTLLVCASINLSVSVVGQFAIYSATPFLLLWAWMALARYRWTAS